MDEQVKSVELTRISKLLEGSFKTQAWHGSSTMALLKDVTVEQALKHPIPNVHSIWEIVNHILVWEIEAKKILEGKTFLFLSQEEYWPAIDDTSEEAWKETVENLEKANHELSEAISKFDVSKLDDVMDISDVWPSPWDETSYYILIHGTIDHDIYHAGQIAILKKG